MLCGFAGFVGNDAYLPPSPEGTKGTAFDKIDFTTEKCFIEFSVGDLSRGRNDL